MKKVLFWKIGDTVVNELEPTRTYIVAEVWQNQKDRWVWLEKTNGVYSSRGQQIIEAKEEYMQQLGFIGYRQQNY